MTEPANDKDAAWWAEVRPEVELLAEKYGVKLIGVEIGDYGAQMSMAFSTSEGGRCLAAVPMREPVDDVIERLGDVFEGLDGIRELFASRGVSF